MNLRRIKQKKLISVAAQRLNNWQKVNTVCVACNLNNMERHPNIYGLIANELKDMQYVYTLCKDATKLEYGYELIKIDGLDTDLYCKTFVLRPRQKHVIITGWNTEYRWLRCFIIRNRCYFEHIAPIRISDKQETFNVNW